MSPRPKGYTFGYRQQTQGNAGVVTSAKLRPALILAVHREEVIIVGIFSKIPAGDLRNIWVLIQDSDAQFSQTGLKKTSLIRANKIATVSNRFFKGNWGTYNQVHPLKCKKL